VRRQSPKIIKQETLNNKFGIIIFPTMKKMSLPACLDSIEWCDDAVVIILVIVVIKPEIHYS
jgi:hypothetical protein